MIHDILLLSIVCPSFGPTAYILHKFAQMTPLFLEIPQCHERDTNETPTIYEHNPKKVPMIPNESIHSLIMQVGVIFRHGGHNGSIYSLIMRIGDTVATT
jgi:hypothetical protein